MCALLIPALIGVGAVSMMSGDQGGYESECVQQCQPACVAQAPQRYYQGSYSYQAAGKSSRHAKVQRAQPRNTSRHYMSQSHMTAPGYEGNSGYQNYPGYQTVTNLHHYTDR